MDGVTKELSDYLRRLESLGDMAAEAIREQIDLEAAAVEDAIRDGVPVNTGGLRASLTRTDIDTPRRYGKRLEFEGNDQNGVPYAKIANVLEYGRSDTKGLRFIRRAVKSLKGLDDRAAARFEEKAKTLID
jgi:hypothetical protein